MSLNNPAGCYRMCTNTSTYSCPCILFMGGREGGRGGRAGGREGGRERINIFIFIDLLVSSMEV